MEVNVLTLNKKTLNSGYIIFDNCKRFKEWIERLISIKVGFTPYVLVIDEHKYYGIKMFRCRNQLFKMCTELKEVLESYA